MGRILLSAPADRPWSWGPHLLAALRDIRPELEFVDFRSVPDPNGTLLRVAEGFRPALHFVAKGEVYRPETLRRLRELGVFNVLWHPDETVPAWLLALAKVCDLFCTQYTGMEETYHQAGIERVGWFQEGITPAFFQHDGTSPEEAERYSCDVVVIGTIDRIPEYRKRLYALNRLMREGFRVKWWGRPMSFWRNPWRAYFSPARSAWAGSMVWNATFAKACRCAKVVLTLPRRPEIGGGLSNGAFWTTGVGGFYMSLYKQGIEEFFDPGREIAVFHDQDDMVEKVARYVEDNGARASIAAAGQRRTLSQYTNQRLLAEFLGRLPTLGGPAV